MKKKRSIQKLSFHKEKISTLNAATGGANVTTTIVNGVTKVASIAMGGTCFETCTVETLNRLICQANFTEDC
ncbi:class I lanthipeptide [Kordia sp.]|uniref:class I lanthipeptide n=1 Tax=Kordia sp. TaxID=1965332 RepID=UPI003D6A18DD